MSDTLSTQIAHETMATLGIDTTDSPARIAQTLVRVGTLFDDPTLLDTYNRHIDDMPALLHDTEQARIALARRIVVASCAIAVQDLMGV